MQKGRPIQPRISKLNDSHNNNDDGDDDGDNNNNNDGGGEGYG